MYRCTIGTLSFLPLPKYAAHILQILDFRGEGTLGL